MQLSALFLKKNDYGVSGIGLKTICSAWGELAADTSIEPTTSMLAAPVYASRPSLRVDDVVLTAERAAFMYYGQVTLTERDGAVCQEELPLFAEKCSKKLLKPRRGGQRRMQQVQHTKNSDVLEQRQFFQQLTPAQLFSWSRGNFSVDVDIIENLCPSNLPSEDEIPATMVEALTTDKTRDMDTLQKPTTLNALALVLDVPISMLDLQELRSRQASVISTYNKCMPAGELAAFLDATGRRGQS